MVKKSARRTRRTHIPAFKVVDLVPLHAKIGQLTLENDFLESALKGLWGPFLRMGKAGLLSAKP